LTQTPRKRCKSFFSVNNSYYTHRRVYTHTRRTYNLYAIPLICIKCACVHETVRGERVRRTLISFRLSSLPLTPGDLLIAKRYLRTHAFSDIRNQLHGHRVLTSNYLRTNPCIYFHPTTRKIIFENIKMRFIEPKMMTTYTRFISLEFHLIAQWYYDTFLQAIAWWHVYSVYCFWSIWNSNKTAIDKDWWQWQFSQDWPTEYIMVNRSWIPHVHGIIYLTNNTIII